MMGRAARRWRCRRLPAEAAGSHARGRRPHLNRAQRHGGCFRARQAGGPTHRARDRLRAKVYDLLKAYAEQRRRTIKVGPVIKVRPVWSISEARERLETLFGSHRRTNGSILERYLGD